MTDEIKVSTWMPLYPGDYLADTAHLSTEEHGAYLLLILHYWKTGKPLANDKQMLARICRVSTRKFAKMYPVLSNFFYISGNTLFHKRIEIEIARAKDKREKRAEAGRKGGKQKAINSAGYGRVVEFMSREEL